MRRMTVEERIHLYAARNNLIQQDEDFFLDLLRRAVAEEREACYQIVVVADTLADAAATIFSRGDNE